MRRGVGALPRLILAFRRGADIGLDEATDARIQDLDLIPCVSDFILVHSAALPAIPRPTWTRAGRSRRSPKRYPLEYSAVILPSSSAPTCFISTASWSSGSNVCPTASTC